MMIFARKIMEDPLIRRDVSLAVLVSVLSESSSPRFEGSWSFSCIGVELLIANLSH